MQIPSSPDSQLGPSLRLITHIIYGLFAIGTLSGGIFGVAFLAAVVLAYFKRGDAAGTVYAPHLDWLLATFWWSVVWFFLSALATLIFVGWLTGLIALIWLIYRVIRGWLALFSGHSPSAMV